jgi:DNA-binding MurR/RpiR family transcriptional regulator
MATFEAARERPDSEAGDLMPTPPELITLPQALTEMMVKARAAYERAVRSVRWGELPIWAIGSARTLPAAGTLRHAFEDLLSWPTIVREASCFLEDSIGMMRPGSVVVVFADASGPPAEAAQAARKRGAQVLVVRAGIAPPEDSEAGSTAAQESPLDLALPIVGAAPGGDLGAACLQHAAAAQLALVCARQLTRPEARLERWEADWRDLPSQLDRIVGLLGDGVASLSRELEPLSPILVVGGGYYSAAARRVSALARQQVRRPVVGLDLASVDGGWLQVLNPKSGLLLLSGSTGRAAKAAIEFAGQVKERGCPLFVLTGSNHHDLIRQARLSLMLPEVGELPGSILALAVSGWMASQLVDPARHARRSRPEL